MYFDPTSQRCRQNALSILILLFAALSMLSLFPFNSKTRAQVRAKTSSGQFGVNQAAPAGFQYYASPTGSPSGDGSINNPWDLSTALNKSTVRPGATIWLRGGVYYLPRKDAGFESKLQGAADNPIKVESYPGEWAVLDGRLPNVANKNVAILSIRGNYTWFLNFEVTNSDPAGRKIDVPSSNPTERRGGSVYDYGVGTKIINLVIHDTGQGIAAWQSGRDNEYYGNVIYNNGWDSPDRLHGHATYVHNENGYKTFENNIFFNQFSMNGRTGGTDAANVKNITFKGNVFFNGLLAWKGPNITNFKVLNNYFFNNVLKVGDEVNSTYYQAEIRDNFAIGGVQLFEFAESVVFEHNTVWNSDPRGKLLVLTFGSPKGPNFKINDNTYYRSFDVYPFWNFKVNYNGVFATTPEVKTRTGYFAYNATMGTQAVTYGYTGKAWRDTFPFDANSTFIDHAPTGVKSFILPNRYDPKRATLVVYNWDLSTKAGVDVSSFLSPGDKYQLRNVQDYFRDVISGTYSGGNLQIQMTGRTQAKPIGYDLVSRWYHDPIQPNTFPMFGVFVLFKTN